MSSEDDERSGRRPRVVTHKSIKKIPKMINNKIIICQKQTFFLKII